VTANNRFESAAENQPAIYGWAHLMARSAMVFRPGFFLLIKYTQMKIAGKSE
jgi:hypothetical protein